MFAVGLAFPIPPEAGKLVIYEHEWDYSDVDNPIYSSKPLRTHACTKEELGLDTSNNSKPHLFPLAKVSVGLIKP